MLINEKSLSHLERSAVAPGSAQRLQKERKPVGDSASSPSSSVFRKGLFYVEALSALAVLPSRKSLIIC